ncbi:UDP-glucose 4-epimerase GalE [Amylibacter sp.]|nr:UDP-glucose 4-epimerase GalE [Amylibacter sp.]
MSIQQKILITGGLGYVGSHIVADIAKNYGEIIIIDNLSNSSIDVLEKLKNFTKKEISFEKVDIRNYEEIKHVFHKYLPTHVVHCAGLKSVSESAKNPLLYYDVNFTGSVNILKAMTDIKCNNIVFSSSATVYGEPVYLPLDERHPTNPINPYGNTKLLVEKLIADWCELGNKSIILRYFNPVGANNNAKIGESPNGIPNNILPYICRVATLDLEKLNIFGDDYDTRDGTGVRDYIHVQDLASAHGQAIQCFDKLHKSKIINLGTGVNTSVMELLNTFEKVNNLKIPYEIIERRIGDTAECWTDCTLANSWLDWYSVKGLNDICRDAWSHTVQNKI